MDHTNETQVEEKVSTIKTFLQTCVKLLNDQSSIKIFKNNLKICNTKVEGKLEHKTFNHLHTRRRKTREFDVNANMGLSYWI
jgi:hypothetical protein